MAQYFESDRSHFKIKNLLTGIDRDISKSQMNNILLNSSGCFKDELSELREAALVKENYQHIDDTSWKILKKTSVYIIVTGNSYFTQFTTIASKARYYAIYALCGMKEPKYRLNDVAIDYTVAAKCSLKLRLLLTG